MVEPEPGLRYVSGYLSETLIYASTVATMPLQSIT